MARLCPSPARQRTAIAKLKSERDDLAGQVQSYEEATKIQRLDDLRLARITAGAVQVSVDMAKTEGGTAPLILISLLALASCGPKPAQLTGLDALDLEPRGGWTGEAHRNKAALLHASAAEKFG